MVQHLQVLSAYESATRQSIHVTPQGARKNTSAGVEYMSSGVTSSISAGIRNILWCVALMPLEITLKDMKLLWVQSLLLHWCWGTKCVSRMSARCVRISAHTAWYIWVVAMGSLLTVWCAVCACMFPWHWPVLECRCQTPFDMPTCVVPRACRLSTSGGNCFYDVCNWKRSPYWIPFSWSNGCVISGSNQTT